MTIQTSRLLGRLLLITLAYFAAGRLGLLIPYFGSLITLIWLPTGIAVGVLMRWGYICWPAIFAGAFLVNFSLGASLTLAGCIAVGNTLGPLLTTWLLRHFKVRTVLDRAHDILVMVAAAGIGMLLSSSGGVSSLLLHGMLPTEQAPQAWLVWWTGDTVGVLLLLPVLLNVSRSELQNIWQQRAKFLVGLGTICLLEWELFYLIRDTSGQSLLLAFLALPMVIWSAMRFGITGASFAVLGLSVIAVWATANAYGPFYQTDIHHGIFSLWVFMSTLSLIALMITVLQSERALTEQALRSSEAKMRAVINAALDCIITADMHGKLVEFNPAAERIFGYKRDEVIGRELADVIIPPEMRERHRQGFQRYTATGESHILDRRLELNAMRADGSEFPAELTITSLHEAGLPLVTGFLRDITERKQAEQEIRNLAFFDVLTGLPNRRLLLDRLQQACATSARSHNHGAVLFVDLDNFKALNDSHGHDVGDLLLIEVAQRLRHCVRDEDTVSRLGGDEFVVILEDLSLELEHSLSQARTVVEKILQAINQPYVLQDIEHHNSSSIGISLFSGYEIAGDELLKRADMAMYEAKSAGRNTLRFFDPSMQAVLEKRVKLESQLRVALSQHQFRMYYQTQVDTERRVFGAEVLLRWEHPKHGLMLPSEFIPLAEESGLIIPIGHWVLYQACQQLKEWESTSYAQGIQLAVNVSARRFWQPDFVAEIREVLLLTGANPHLLKLELTESVVLDNIADTIEKMHALKELGIRFSMDDFGTGYSSLAYLKQLPLTQVKIDQSFVRDIAIDPSDAAIVQTIIGMSNTLGLNVIAEGVETEAQFEFLQQYGCRQFQGYLFSKPVILEDFERILQSDRLLFVTDSSENSSLI